MNRSILLIVIFASFITYCSCDQPSEETVVHHNIHAAVDSTWKEYKLTMQAGIPGVRLYLPPVYDTSRFDTVGTSDGISDCTFNYNYQFKQKANKWHRYQSFFTIDEMLDSLYMFRIFYAFNAACDAKMQKHFSYQIWYNIQEQRDLRTHSQPSVRFDTIVSIDSHPFYVSGDFATFNYNSDKFRHKGSCMQYYSINGIGLVEGRILHLSFSKTQRCKQNIHQYIDECFNVMGTMSFIK